VNQDEKNDILLAALFHDTGFARRYEANEAIGAEIA
jgi:HD superfamily phosphodiesterase